MNNRFLISVAALALVAGTGFANAQGAGNNRESGGAAMHQNSPSMGGGAASERGGGAMENRESSQSGVKSTQSEQKPKSPTVGQSERGEQKPGMKSNAPGAKSTESEQGKSSTVGQSPRSEESAGQKSKSMSSEENKGGKEMKAQGRETHEGRSGNMNAQGAEGRNQLQGEQGRAATSAQSREGTSSSQTTTTTGQAGAAAKLSTEQRTQISTVIRDQHVAPANNVSFSVAVGTRISREGISLHPLPSRVVEIYPEWRGYEFILVRDEIVVVDPRTFEIVAVLPA